MNKKSRKTLIKQVIQPVNDNAGANVGSKPHDGIDRSPAKVAEAKDVLMTCLHLRPICCDALS